MKALRVAVAIVTVMASSLPVLAASEPPARRSILLRLPRRRSGGSRRPFRDCTAATPVRS